MNSPLHRIESVIVGTVEPAVLRCRFSAKPTRTLVMITGCLLMLTSLSGCKIWDWWKPGGGEQANVMPMFPADITARELGDHINKNSEKLFAWRSTNVKVQTKGPASIPIKLNANLAVESPRNFRLVARAITGTEADLGSNQDRFWFWMRRAQPPHVITVKHEHLPMVQRTFELPLQPDWLMEALGVIPVDTAQARLLPSEDKNSVLQLETRHQLPSGKVTLRVFDVNKITGNVVHQALYDEQNQLLASASFQDHQADPKTGITLPHRIDLNWPQAKMELTLHIGDVEINPGYIPQNLWELPHIPNSPVMDIGERLARQQPAAPTQVAEGPPLQGIQRQPREGSSSPIPPLDESPTKQGSPFYEESEIPDFSQQAGFETPENPTNSSPIKEPRKNEAPAWWDQ